MSQTSVLQRVIANFTYLFVGIIVSFMLMLIYHFQHEIFEQMQMDLVVVCVLGLIFSVLMYGFFSIRTILFTLFLQLESKQKEIEHLNHLLEQKISEQTAELKQKQEELAKSEQRLSFALQGSMDALWDFDVPAAQVYFNPRWFEMLGYPFQDTKIPFAYWEALIHPDDCTKTLKLLHDHLDGLSESYISEHRLHCKNGEYK